MNQTMSALLFLVALPLAACSPGESPRVADAAEKPPPTIEAPWQRAEIVYESGEHAGRHTVDVQPSLYIFSKTHYAITAVNGFAPRPYLGEKPTVEEEGAPMCPSPAIPARTPTARTSSRCLR